METLEKFDPRKVPVRFSSLKRMELSPAHYLGAIADPDAFEVTPAMRIGLAVHALILGGEMHVYDGERKGNAWKVFEALHLAKTSEFLDDGNQVPRIITIKELEKAQRIAAAVRRNKLAMGLIEGAATEHLINWNRGGRAGRSHLDIFEPGMFVAELKVTVDAHPDRFARQCGRMGTLAQLALYREIGNVSNAYTIAVEARYPHPVTVQQLTDRALVAGDKSITTWWERLMTCEAANQWPEYSQSITPLDTLDDFELDFGGEAEAA
jgi:hypothetical protein